ncbi:CYTH domain-containing protein [Parabacteroides sp. OttesenSCG-928-G21]|nr:CYTH domain-containing protein [Parabacteroides sp. OttesenSCG-928-G21]
MATETERKFLVAGDFKPAVTKQFKIKQGYISASSGRTVRVRIRDDKGFLTIKGPSENGGLTRYEFEQEILLKDAEDLFRICLPGTIEKIRYHVPFKDHLWEVDVFEGENEGLILAEIELSSEDETFEKPGWLGQEVTGDTRFYNSMLSKHPFKLWKQELK